MGRNTVMIPKISHIKRAARFCFHRGHMVRNNRLWMLDYEDELRKSIVDGEGVLNAADKRW
jgi:hypothetical protein